MDILDEHEVEHVFFSSRIEVKLAALSQLGKTIEENDSNFDSNFLSLF